MTDIKEIKGFRVKNIDDDPVVYTRSWSSGGNLPTALSSVRGLGPQTAAVAVGGLTLPGPTSNATFHYDGSTWSTVPATLNTARGFANISKLGTQTAGIYFAGSPYVGINESYDGTSWTEVGDLNTARQELGGSGTQTAALATGGRISSPAYVGNNESWNGSAWTEVNDLNTARGNLDSTGTSTDSIAGGGTIAPASPAVGVNAETWNGTSWTTITSFSTARRANSMLGLTSTDAIVVGGDTSGSPFPAQTLTAATEYWNGSSWTELNDLTTGRANAGSSGSATAGLIEGGYGPPASYLTATEELSYPPITASNLTEGQVWFNSTSQTLKGYGKAAGIPSASWATGGNLNTARRSLAGSTRGSQTSSIAFGGFSTTNVGNTESYNGSSWTEVNDLNTARQGLGGAGTATAALTMGGYTGTARVGNTESWDGSSWTEVNDLNQARNGGNSFGTQSSAIYAGGNLPPSTVYNNTESWDGTSWTEITEINTARYGLSSLGTSGDGLFTGGETSLGAPAITGATEIWNGSSWTEVADLNQVRYDFGSGGGETSGGIVFGGYTGTVVATNTEFFNGSTWTELNDLSQSVYGNTGMGSSVAALKVGGISGANLNATEEWTASAAVTTITTS